MLDSTISIARPIFDWNKSENDNNLTYRQDF